MESDTSDDSRGHDNDFTQSLLRSLQSQQQMRKFTDFVIIVDGESIPAHRNIISAACPYFRMMFESHMKEEIDNEVRLDNLDVVSVKQIVDYLYTGNISVAVESVDRLFEACDFLLLDDLKKKCTLFIINQINAQNCISWYRFATLYQMEDIIHPARFCMRYEFSAVTESQEFMNMTYIELVDFVTDDQLHVRTEDPVLAGCIKWVEYDLEERCQYLISLMLKLPLRYCSTKYLHHVMGQITPDGAWCGSAQQSVSPVRSGEGTGGRNKRSKSNRGSLTVIDVMEIYKILSTALLEKTSNSVNVEAPGRKTFGSQRVVIVGGSAQDKWEACLAADPKEEVSSWEKLSTLPLTVNGFASSTCQVPQGGFIISGGLRNSYSVHKDVFHYVAKTNKWTRLCSLNTARYRHGSVAVGQQIFAIGGSSTATPGNKISKMEVLDEDFMEWTNLTSMLVPMVQPIVATVGMSIYVVLSVCDENAMEQQKHGIAVQKYDVINDRWSLQRPLDAATSTKGARAVSINQHIYVAGGQEKLCLQYNPEQDLWSALVSPLWVHNHGSLINFGNRLLLMGGDGDGENIVEEYVPGTNQWNHLNWTLPHSVTMRDVVIIAI